MYLRVERLAGVHGRVSLLSLLNSLFEFPRVKRARSVSRKDCSAWMDDVLLLGNEVRHLIVQLDGIEDSKAHGFGKLELELGLGGCEMGASVSAATRRCAGFRLLTSSIIILATRSR